MIVQQRVGFVHGVMNTDNMSTHGLTDYGPYAGDDRWTRTPRTGRSDTASERNLTSDSGTQLANALYLVGKVDRKMH